MSMCHIGHSKLFRSYTINDGKINGSLHHCVQHYLCLGSTAGGGGPKWCLEATVADKTTRG